MTSPTNNIVIDLIVPVFNESDRMVPHIKDMLNTVYSAGFTPHIIMVDDGSTDNTWGVIKELNVQFPEIEGVRLSRNFGKDNAIFTGLKYSHGMAAITIDSDGQHPISMIPEMLTRWSNGTLIVHAVKAKRSGEGHWVKLRAKIFNSIISKLMGTKLEGVSDYKLLDKKVVEILRLCATINSVYRFFVVDFGFPSSTVPMNTLPSPRPSRWNLRSLFQLSIRAIMFHTDVPIKAFVLLILLTIGLAVTLVGILVFSLIFGTVSEGYSTILVLSLLNLCITTLGITGVSVYLKTTLDIVAGRTGATEWERTFIKPRYENE
jgi:glycosyltransferase involved in cell wall biosynthesis